MQADKAARCFTAAQFWHMDEHDSFWTAGLSARLNGPPIDVIADVSSGILRALRFNAGYPCGVNQPREWRAAAQCHRAGRTDCILHWHVARDIDLLAGDFIMREGFNAQVRRARGQPEQDDGAGMMFGDQSWQVAFDCGVACFKNMTGDGVAM